MAYVCTHAQTYGDVQMNAHVEVEKGSDWSDHSNQSLQQINGMWLSAASTAEMRGVVGEDVRVLQVESGKMMESSWIRKRVEVEG